MQPQYTREFALGALPEDAAAGLGTGLPVSTKLFVQFFTHEMKDEARSASMGRAVHRTIEMIRVIIPGDKHSAMERRVKSIDKEQYPREYAAFQKGQEMAVDGTRLEDWPILTRAQILDLKSLNIFTVEHLAGLSDEQLQRVGIGARQMRQHAQAFLEVCKTSKLPAALVAELEERRNREKLLVSQISDLTTKMESMMVKLGMSPEDASNPVTTARAMAAQTVGAASAIEIPEHPAQLSLVKLKEIVAQFSAAPARNKDEALELIKEYQASRAALK